MDYQQEPGLIMEHTKPPATLLPSRTVGILVFSNAMAVAAFNVVYPFINQMIVELGIAKTADSAGYYSGLLQSGVALSGFLTTIPCSYASDIYGRKPVLIASMVGVMISMFFFGTGGTFATLFMSRCIGGVFGPNLTWMVSYTVLGEIEDPSNAAPAYSALNIGYSIGSMLSPSIGGFLARPSNHFAVFNSEFWRRNPYALPCFTGVLLGAIGLVIISTGFTETLPSKCDGVLDHGIELSDTHTSISDLGRPQNNSVHFISPLNSQDTSETSEGPESFLLAKKSVSVWAVLTPQTIPVLATSFALSFISSALFAIYPLWAFASIDKGGLGASESSIGFQLSIGGLMDILLMLIYGNLVKSMGLYTLYSFSMSMWIPTVLCYPLFTYWARFEGSSEGLMFQTSMIVWFFLWSLSGLAWPANSQMVNMVAPFEEALARTIGVSTIFSLLGRTVGPIVATSFYHWSTSLEFANGNVIWVALFIVSNIAAMHASKLRGREPGEISLYPH